MYMGTVILYIYIYEISFQRIKILSISYNINWIQVFVEI